MGTCHWNSHGPTNVIEVVVIPSSWNMNSQFLVQFERKATFPDKISKDVILFLNHSVCIVPRTILVCDDRVPDLLALPDDFQIKKNFVKQIWKYNRVLSPKIRRKYYARRHYITPPFRTRKNVKLKRSCGSCAMEKRRTLFILICGLFYAAPYGIFARSCVAMAKDSKSTFQIIDDEGCPVDPTIFPGFSPEGNALQSVYEAFRFTESYGVIFQCNVKYCLGPCEPVI